MNKQMRPDYGSSPLVAVGIRLFKSGMNGGKQHWEIVIDKVWVQGCGCTTFGFRSTHRRLSIIL